MPLSGVLFDLDDTLFDNTASTRAGLGAVVAACGCVWTPEQLLQRYREILAELDPLVFSGQLDARGARLARFGRLLHEWNATTPDPEQAAKLYRRAYVGAYAECEGAAAIVQTLRQCGWRVGVLTNYLREVQTEKLERLGLLPLVDIFLCVDDLPAAKPDPRAFLTACEALGSLPEQTVMVGDSLKNDVLGARTAGLHTVWYNRLSDKSHGPTIRRLAELPGLLEVMAKLAPL